MGRALRPAHRVGAEWEQTGDPRREAHADTYWVWDGPAIGARVRHQRHGEGVVTSIGSQDWVFVKFPQFIASRMCHVAFLEEL